MSVLQARVERGVAILEVEGRLIGGPETVELRERIRETFKDGHRRILVNVRGVPWVNSIGLGALVAAFASIRRQDGRLEICCPSHRVEMIFLKTRLMPDLFGDFRCEEEALRRFDRDDPGARGRGSGNVR